MAAAESCTAICTTACSPISSPRPRALRAACRSARRCWAKKVQDVLSAGTHGSTFGGNPVCCAGAINVLSRLDEKMLEGVEERSAYIKQELAGAKGVLGVSGLGLMLGIQTEKNASDIIAACREKGVLVIKAKDKLRLLPALNIPMEQLQKGRRRHQGVLRGIRLL